MKNSNVFIFIFSVFVLSMSGCSYSPGVPSLNTSVGAASKPHKVGIDYRLIEINHKMIKNQKPFNYNSYILNKKKSNAAQKNWSKNTQAFSRTPNQSASRQNAGKTSTGTIRFSSINSSDNKANYKYVIGKRDILSITVWDHPELTIPAGDAPATHVIGNDGRFYFPYAGKIQAAGKTAEAVRAALENKLTSFIAKPQVSVRVAQHRSQKAFISGAIAKPLTLEINDLPLTVRDAISKSGGVIPRKYTGYASLTRDNQTIAIDLNRMLRLNDNRQNFILRNGDRLHVVEISDDAEFLKNLLQAKQREEELTALRKELERESRYEQAKMFVMGEVGKPGTVKYQLEDGMTLAEAINDAGSFKEETFNPKGVFVVRQKNKNDTIPTVYQLPVASVHSMLLAEQFNIRPRDIVYVTSTPSIRWNRVLGLLLPSLTLLNTFNNLSN